MPATAASSPFVEATARFVSLRIVALEWPSAPGAWRSSFSWSVLVLPPTSSSPEHSHPRRAFVSSRPWRTRPSPQGKRPSSLTCETPSCRRRSRQRRASTSTTTSMRTFPRHTASRWFLRRAPGRAARRRRTSGASGASACTFSPFSSSPRTIDRSIRPWSRPLSCKCPSLYRPLRRRARRRARRRRHRPLRPGADASPIPMTVSGRLLFGRPQPARGRVIAQASYPSRRATDHPAANGRQSRVHLELQSGQAIGTLPLP